MRNALRVKLSILIAKVFVLLLCPVVLAQPQTAQRLLYSLRGHKGWVSSGAFNPDGKRIASASNGIVNVWNCSVVPAPGK